MALIGAYGRQVNQIKPADAFSQSSEVCLNLSNPAAVTGQKYQPTFVTMWYQLDTQRCVKKTLPPPAFNNKIICKLTYPD